MPPPPAREDPRVGQIPKICSDAHPMQMQEEFTAERCVVSLQPIPVNYIKFSSLHGRLNCKYMYGLLINGHSANACSFWVKTHAKY